MTDDFLSEVKGDGQLIMTSDFVSPFGRVRYCPSLVFGTLSHSFRMEDDAWDRIKDSPNVKDSVKEYGEAETRCRLANLQLSITTINNNNNYDMKGGLASS